MARPLKNLKRRLLGATGLHAVWLWRLGYLTDTGWARSLRLGECVGRNGAPMPWFTFPMIAFLEKRVDRTMSVFEYGSGNSTLWWSARVRRVVSCEHDPQWYERVRRRAPDHVEILQIPLSPQETYTRAATGRGELFDIIVIDGRDRVLCATRCLPALKPGGVVIWDNTDRGKYAAGLAELASQGFRRLEFQGMCALEKATSETSVLYRPGNCLGI